MNAGAEKAMAEAAVRDRTAERPSQPIELLALDVDGTILDRTGSLHESVRRALQEAEASGVRVILCTGRRFRRASAMASALGSSSPMVCNSGALVKCPVSARSLWRAEHSPEHVGTILDVIAEAGVPALSFLDAGLEGPDFVTAADPSGCPLFDQYLRSNTGFARIDPNWQTRLADRDEAHFHVCAAGSHEAMAEIERKLHERLPDARFRTFVQKSPNYVAWMCEVLRGEASKWTALRSLTDAWGIAPESICAVGDDANDVPMIAAAGWGVAMGHAEPEIRRHAHWVAPSNTEHGVVDVVRIVLESRR